MLKNADYTAVIVAAGASEPGVLRLEKGEAVNALKFLADFKAKDGDLDIGKNVVIIGGGNTAMDTARAAKRTKGVEHAYLVYRRTKRYMPADEEELQMAIDDGVEFMELLAPVKLEDGKALLANAVKYRAPYMVCKYLMELANSFHHFYNFTRVLSQDKKDSLMKLSLVNCFRIVMAKMLNLMGVSAPEKM